MKFLRFIFILLYVFLLTIISWFINGKSLIGIDDANIYMVYMRNFANGYGFVYNIGGERVEGFTSLLWTLLGTIFFYISKNPEKFLLLFNISIISYTLFIVSNYIEREAGARNKMFSKQSLFFLGAIGVTPGFIDWTVLSLMDSGIWCFLLTTTSLKTIINKDDNKFKHYSILGLQYVFLVICRPESMLLVPFYIILNLLKEYLVLKSIKSIVKWTLYSSVFFIIALLALIYWRLNYFGYPFPNTYYAKVSSSISDNIALGIRYIQSLFNQKPFFFFLIFFSLVIFIKSIIQKSVVSKVIFILFLIMMISFAIPLYSGGDHFGLHRFIMPFIPVIFLLGVLVLKELNFFRSRIKIVLLLLLLFITNEHNFIDFYMNKNYPIRHEWEIAVRGRIYSQKLNEFFSDNEKLPSQGVITAGGTAFGYNGETVDLLGLNNTKIAHAYKVKDKNLPKNHASFNPDIFFELSTDLFWYLNCGFVSSADILPEKIKLDTSRFFAFALKNIQLDKRFKDVYGYYRIHNLHYQKEDLLIFASKKFVSSLDTSIYKVNSIDFE